MRRVLVLGGLGQFGRTAADQLRIFGVEAGLASRRGAADIRIDANDPPSIRRALRPGDIVIDAAGPFHARTTALLECAIEIGVDVIDINDNLGYAEAVTALERRVAVAGIRVLSSASTVSAVAAAAVRHSGIEAPRRVTTFLAPASRHTANAGAALSLMRSLGRSVRVYREGSWQQRAGWSESRQFPMPPPVGPICGRLFEAADSLYLPRIWPTLRDVAMYVDPNTPGVDLLLRLAARSSALRGLLQRQVSLASWFARAFGSAAGGVGYEIEDAAGRVTRYAILAQATSFIAAVAPAVLACRAIVEDRFSARGLVRPNRHVEPGELFAFLESKNVTVQKLL